MVGETRMEVAVAAVFHTYVPPPDAVSVALCPEQIAFVPVMPAVTELIFTVKVAELEQLFASVTVTV